MNAVIRQDSRLPEPALTVCVVSLLAFGSIMVASTSLSLSATESGEPLGYLLRHLAALGGGLLGLLVAAWIRLEFWFRLNGILLIAAFALLIMVLIPGLGVAGGGATRWLVIGPLRLQASEPARLFFVIYLASYAVRHARELSTTFSSFFRPLLLVTLFGFLLLVEPDFGALVVVAATSLGLLFVAGSRLRDFFLAVIAAVVILGALILSAPYRLARVVSYLDPFADPFDSGFQLVNSLIAIGRGSWFGVGLGESIQKLFYLPEAHTDFVFAVIAEELGFAGATAVVILFVILVFRAIVIGQRALDAGLEFPGLVSIGIGLMIGIEAFINIGVNIGLLPTKGLALPLLSYGRSSLVVTLFAVGLIIRVAHETRLAQAENAAGERP